MVAGSQIRRNINFGDRCERQFGSHVSSVFLFFHPVGDFRRGFLDFDVQRLRCRQLILVVLLENVVVDFLADCIVTRDQCFITGTDLNGLQVTFGDVVGARHLRRIDDD